MTDDSLQQPEKLSWRFPRTFWFANTAELFERAAYYGMFITLLRYLNVEIGFTDPQAGWITGLFAGFLYFFPTFMGIMADKISFRRALMLAFALLSLGYWLLGAYQLKGTALLALFLIMCGGAIVKPVISGTAAKCSSEINRARAMSIFYMVVNIGSFSGKFLAGYLNDRLGLQYINLYAAGMALAALVLVSLFYRNPDVKGTGKTFREAWRGLWTVMRNFRFLCLIFIVAGFWLIQGQLYGAMPSYVERLLGEGSKPEYLANINPAVVVCCVVLITHLIRNLKPENAIGIGLFIIPFTALAMALSPVLEALAGSSINFGLFSLHPITVTIIVGVGLQGIAECFLSPKFLEYASKQAPPGEVGLYLGYQHLTTFFAWLLGLVLAGYLLNAYCPDPKRFTPEARHEWRLATNDEYRFALDPSLKADIKDNAPVAESIRRALHERGIDIPQTAKLTPADSKDVWKITGLETEHRIKKIEYPVETELSPEEKAKLHCFARLMFAIFGHTEKVSELLVYADSPRGAEASPPLPEVYAEAHHIWFVFASIGALAFFGLIVFKYVTAAIDRKRADATG
ncbi:MAG: MFS transporter [Phycisphaerae bacterium]|nr:MFS transporter [Phycisphaerae bacterium]